MERSHSNDLLCKSQFTGLYMIRTSIMKAINIFSDLENAIVGQEGQ